MCGRYTLLADELKILQEYDLERQVKGYQTSYNVAPGENVLAIIHDGRERRAGYLKWGLVPSWAEDSKAGYRMINARSETAAEKPSFRNLLREKRCLIIADSFYEWQKTGQTKQAKRIKLRDRSLFAFAGLWDRWEQDGEVLFTCTILTKPANSFMEDIHQRMPVILPKDKEKEWIQPGSFAKEEFKGFIRDLKEEDMTAYNVSNHVNNARNKDFLCIEPAG